MWVPKKGGEGGIVLASSLRDASNLMITGREANQSDWNGVIKSSLLCVSGVSDMLIRTEGCRAV